MSRHKVEICGVNTANVKVLIQNEIVEFMKKHQLIIKIILKPIKL